MSETWLALYEQVSFSRFLDALDTFGHGRLYMVLVACILVLASWMGSNLWVRLTEEGQQLNDVMLSLDNLAEPVIMMRRHTISYVNRATLITFGYEEKSDLEGKSVTILMTQKDSIAHQSYVSHFETTGEHRVIGKPRVVVGRRRDGTSVSLTLSVSPCAKHGEYVGILYPRTEMEARASAEAALQAKTNELLESEIERLKLQVRSGAPVTPAAVVRDPKVVEAWTGSWAEASMNRSASFPDVKFSCIAAYPDALGKTVQCRWLHRGRALGDALVILMPGSHAFVKVHTEPFLRLSPLGTEFGRASGHPQLADEKPVLYAGEIEVDQQGTILRWSNMSGTYKAEDTMCFQTELPLDKFWAVHSEPIDPDDDADRHLITSTGTVLRRVLSLSDADFVDLRNEWDDHVACMCRNDPRAKACFERIQESSNERCDAVGKYGYLTQIRLSGSATSEPNNIIHT